MKGRAKGWKFGKASEAFQQKSRRLHRKKRLDVLAYQRELAANQEHAAWLDARRRRPAAPVASESEPPSDTRRGLLAMSMLGARVHK